MAVVVTAAMRMANVTVDSIKRLGVILADIIMVNITVIFVTMVMLLRPV